MKRRERNFLLRDEYRALNTEEIIFKIKFALTDMKTGDYKEIEKIDIDEFSIGL